jgi:hypothetical protein
LGQNRDSGTLGLGSLDHPSRPLRLSTNHENPGKLARCGRARFAPRQMCNFFCLATADGCGTLEVMRRSGETQWLAAEKNLSALADLSGRWINAVHGRRPPKGVVLDMESSVSPTHGEQENSVWNGH